MSARGALLAFACALALAGPGAASAARIAFVCGRDVCSAGTDGSARRHLTRGRQLMDLRFGVLSASRAGVIAYAGAPNDVVIMRIGGGVITRIHRLPGITPMDVALDATGQRVQWTDWSQAASRWCRRTVSGRRAHCGIWDSGWSWYAWGPNGTVAAVEDSRSPVVLRKRICILGWRNRCQHVIARTGREDTTFWGPAVIAPDGRTLAVAEDIELTTPEGFGDSRAALTLFSTRTGRRVRRLRYSGVHTYENPTWSPDGRWLAFDYDARWPGTPGEKRKWSVWKMRPTGGKARRILTGGRMPAWGD